MSMGVNVQRKPRNARPCSWCSSHNYGCRVVEEDPRLCVRCERKGFLQCPEHIPWRDRRLRQVSNLTVAQTTPTHEDVLIAYPAPAQPASSNNASVAPATEQYGNGPVPNQQQCFPAPDNINVSQGYHMHQHGHPGANVYTGAHAAPIVDTPLVWQVPSQPGPSSLYPVHYAPQPAVQAPETQVPYDAHHWASNGDKVGGFNMEGPQDLVDGNETQHASGEGGNFMRFRFP